ncbi:MAG TPA: glycerate kinase [Opitutae bacterium]|nr:glycerate kinase [Opitutaceae bacterium]HCR28783.1 glycerate kinase [Opitutae bacterium]
MVKNRPLILFEYRGFPMRVLLAFDKFKDALSAREACKAAADELGVLRPDWEIDTAPLADGGDGFCDTLAGILDGDFHIASVTDPRQRVVDARYGLVSAEKIPAAARRLLNWSPEVDQIAVIEMAESSGIALTPIDGRSPWDVTTAGLGELVKISQEKGAQGAIIGLGGSATHDLALGALWKLGYRFFDKDDNQIDGAPIPNIWPRIAKISLSSTQLPESFQIRLACDVENPLLGNRGAAAIFGPQKGLTKDRFQELESETERLADLLIQADGAYPASRDEAGAGAAGGAAFGLKAGLEAQIVSGYSLVKAWIGLDEKFSQADWVITGEGRFDESSLHGKGPGALALETIAKNKRLLVLAGSIGSIPDCPIAQASLRQISAPSLPLPEALQKTEENMRKALREHFAQSS